MSSAAEKKVVPTDRPSPAPLPTFGLDVSVARDGTVAILPTLPAPGERAITLRMRGA